jgi:hypothetical protein
VTIRKFAPPPPPKKKENKKKKEKTAVKFNRRTWGAWDVGVCAWKQHRGQILPTILFAATRLSLLSFGCPQLMAGTRKGSWSSNVHSATTIARTTGTRSFKLVPPSCCVACFCRQLSFFTGVTRSGSVAAGGGSLGSESRCCLSYFFRPDHSLCFLHLWVVGKFCLCPRLLLISLV